MNIPSDFDPLAWGEKRYIQPIMTSATKWSNEPSFGMKVDGTTPLGPVYTPWHAFDASNTSYWGQYAGALLYAVLTFEKPLRIVGLLMRAHRESDTTYNLYGISDDDDPSVDGTLLGSIDLATDLEALRYECLKTVNNRTYTRYRLEQVRGVYNRVYDIKLDALYRPADF